MNKKHSFLVYTLFFALLVLAGCKTSRTERPIAIEGYKTAEEFIADVEQGSLEFKTLAAKVNIELHLPGKNISSRVDMKMIRDSVFQLSEIGRAHV